MAVSKWKPSDLLVLDDAVEFVYFQIKGKTQQVKIHKSVLIENSSFFKDMFNLPNDEPLKPIPVDDDIGYDLLEAFKSFTDALYQKNLDFGGNDRQPEFIKKLAFLYQVYHFADKYAIDWLVEDCKTNFNETLKISYDTRIVDYHGIVRVVQAATKMNLNVEEVKSKIKWWCQKDDVNQAFKYATEKGFEDLKEQVVAYCCYLDFDPSWPRELNEQIHKRFQELPSKSLLKGCLTKFQLTFVPEDKKHLV